MTKPLKNYTYSKSAKTVTLTDITTARLDRLKLIVDVTINAILYNFADPTVTATVATNIVTLSAVPSGSADADKLLVIYDPLSTDSAFADDVVPINDNGGSLTVDGTVAVTAASLPLPALAATSTKQSDGSQKSQVVDGSGNVIGATSNALDVNIKSGNPTTITATQATGTNLHTVIDSVTGNVSTSAVAATRPASTTMQSAATGNANGTSLDVTGQAVAVLNIVSSVAMSGGTTVQFEASVDDTTWVAIGAHQIGAQGTITSFTQADGDFRVPCAGYKSVRARIRNYSAGTITVKGYAVPTASHPNTIAAAPGAITKHVSVAAAALTASTAATKTLTVPSGSGEFTPAEVEVSSLDGAAVVYGTLDGTTPSSSNYAFALPATPCSVTLPANATTTVKVISAGTPLIAATLRGN